MTLARFPDVLLDAEDERWLARANLTICNGYLRRDTWSGAKRRVEYVHRIIAGAKRGEQVDHINGNRLDNRRANLRIVTAGQNNQNRKGANKNNRTTGKRGVYVDRRDGAIFARLVVNRRPYELGRFETIEAADAAVHDARARMMSHSSQDRRGTA